MLTIERYASTRFWALYENRQLLCVTVYKKGALAVKNRIERNVPLEAPRSPEPSAAREGGAARAERTSRRSRWYR